MVTWKTTAYRPSGNCSSRVYVEMASSYGTSKRIKPGKWNHIEQQNLGTNLSLHCWQVRTTTQKPRHGKSHPRTPDEHAKLGREVQALYQAKYYASRKNGFDRTSNEGRYNHHQEWQRWRTCRDERIASEETLHGTPLGLHDIQATKKRPDQRDQIDGQENVEGRSFAKWSSENSHQLPNDKSIGRKNAAVLCAAKDSQGAAEGEAKLSPPVAGYSTDWNGSYSICLKHFLSMYLLTWTARLSVSSGWRRSILTN